MASNLRHEIKLSKPFTSVEAETHLNIERTAAVLGQPSYNQVSVTVSGRTSVVAASSSPQAGCPAQPASDGFRVSVNRVLLRGGAQVGTEEYHVAYVPFAGTTCNSGSTASSGMTSSTPSSGATSSAPSGGGSGSGTQNPPPSSAPSSAPPSSSGGVLGGLLH